MKKQIGIEIICSLLVILFVYAGLSKLINITTFKLQLGQSPYLSRFPGFIGLIVPVMELAVAFLLVFKKTRLAGLYFSFFLMLLFTGYIYIMLHFSYYVPCSCGGVLSMMSWEQHLTFNLFFTLIALSGILLFPKSRIIVVGN
jgi:hypothetical protein